MTARSRVAALFLLAATSASCGNSNSGSGGPSGVTTNVAVSVPAIMKVGEAVQATAVATLSGGSAKPVSSGWYSDAPAVATVSATGVVTGIANGLANISATADGVQGTSRIRVVPNYEGQWSGVYKIDRSTPFPSSSYQNMCTDYTAGLSYSLSMTLAQTGQSVTGQVNAGGVQSPAVVSLIDATGATSLVTSSTNSVYQYDFTWRLSVPAPGQIAGTVSLSRTGSAGLIGGCAIEGTILTLTR